MEPEVIREPVVATNELREDHIAAAKDIIQMAEETGQYEFAQMIRYKYGIAKIETYNMEESEFVQAARKSGLNVYAQGHIQVGYGEEAIRYPIVSMSDDIRKFNEFYEKMKTNES